uniref:ELM2 domain-containing protein n=1 Tax=Heterorhabditis bacteriophora TaxID=37862 RepID=A0A1I7X0X1_HETBA
MFDYHRTTRIQTKDGYSVMSNRIKIYLIYRQQLLTPNCLVYHFDKHHTSTSCTQNQFGNDDIALIPRMKDELSCTIPVAVWQPFEGEDAAMLPKVYSLSSVRTQENDFIGMNETVLPTCFAKRSPTHLLQRYVESSETYEDLGTLLDGKEEFNVIQATEEVEEEDHHLPSCLNSVDTESSVATIRKKNENIHYSEVLNHLMEHKRIPVIYI